MTPELITRAIATLNAAGRMLVEDGHTITAGECFAAADALTAMPGDVEDEKQAAFRKQRAPWREANLRLYGHLAKREE